MGKGSITRTYYTKPNLLPGLDIRSKWTLRFGPELLLVKSLEPMINFLS